MHVAGTMEQDGEKAEIDLHLQGEDAIGSLTMGGVDIELLSVDGAVYLQAPPEFWASFGMPEDAAAMFDGQWVIVPGDAAAEFATSPSTGSSTICATRAARSRTTSAPTRSTARTSW
ncbi:hypothetical protein [Blastococcus mobilis]|uniref:Uncharacterized protein n=1 Tax=Blastococcus mobilis TaxID=1938746 RepID=A0A238YIH6_9ACTN|nr:hypothetical protein [Blastococcus mobilis]SNR70521.1 hypothetical protein SAMN06272737_12032 [Blastococcus mobilis]